MPATKHAHRASSPHPSNPRGRRRTRTWLPARWAAVLLAAAFALSLAAAAAANTSHAGWPPIENFAQHANDENGTLRGKKGVHNELLGGQGNDTIFAGDAGDVIWGDSRAGGQPESQRDYLHGGAGNDYIYASHGFNEIWTGAGNDHLQLVYGHGTVHCNGPGLKKLVMRFLPSNRPWTLDGCSHKQIEAFKA
jgi:Ca2+-binding RTX toxin-like protein